MCAYLAIRPEGKTPTPPEPAEVDIETTIVALGAVGGTQFTAAEKSSLRRRIVAAGRPRLERRQARSARLRGSTPRAGLGRPGPCRVALQPGRGLGTRWQEVFIGDRRPGTDNQGETYQEGRKEGRKERFLSPWGVILIASLISGCTAFALELSRGVRFRSQKSGQCCDPDHTESRIPPKWVMTGRQKCDRGLRRQTSTLPPQRPDSGRT